MLLRLFFCLLCFAGGLQMAIAQPARILLIRHAEKPDESSEDLSPEGYARAEALTMIFEKNPELASRGLPSAYFAAKFVPGESARRCEETLTPLARKYGLPLQTPYLPRKTRQMAEYILNDPALNGKTLMIAWKHSNLPELAQELGAEDAPGKWPSEAFDRVWVLDFEAQGGSFNVKFRDIPQNLMPGDSQK